jgi:hypothetical protein
MKEPAMATSTELSDRQARLIDVSPPTSELRNVILTQLA